MKCAGGSTCVPHCPTCVKTSEKKPAPTVSGRFSYNKSPFAFHLEIPATAGSPVRTRASDQHIFSKTTSAEYSRAIFRQHYAKSRCKNRRHRAKVSIAAESSLRFVNRCRSNKPTTSNNAQ